MITIKTNNYNSVDDFIYDLLGKYEGCEEFECVNVVARYDVMIEILNQLVKTTDLKITNIKINYAEIDNYADEYILTVSSDEIWCQEAKYDDKYVSVDGVTFVHSDCNSKFVVANKGEWLIEFSIDKEEDFFAINESANQTGFTTSWTNDNGYSSYSFYSSNRSLVESMLEKVKEFHMGV